MTGNEQHIIQHIFKANSLNDVPLKQIEDLSSHYPYFNVGHYLFSKKLFNEKADDFLDKTKKTALYFSNPFWLQWLLQNEADENFSETKTSPVSEAAQMHSVKSDTPLPIEAVEKISRADNKEQKSDTKEDSFLFSPYHTVDYFASLGIKLNLDELQNDKFGKQLKSFTDWLKIMKKLPQKDVVEHSTDTTVQAAIEGYAAHSILQKEIITEAMAEVLSKQGKKENAIELYNKLSLINPGKSAYFAAKIEQLKEH